MSRLNEIADLHPRVQANRSNSMGELFNAEQRCNGRDRLECQHRAQQAPSNAFLARAEQERDETELADRGSDDGERDRDCHENPAECLGSMLRVIRSCRYD